jgi:hypothetical protein
VLRHREVREKLLHLRRPHGLRMAFVMKKNKPFDPLDIRVFRAETIVAGPDHLPHLLQEPGLLTLLDGTVLLHHRALLRG